MTAGQIAPRIHQKDVTINYLASDILAECYEENGYLVEWYKENPMPYLEFSQHGFDFKWMQHTNPDYTLESYFPENVNFKEPRAPPHTHKDEVFEKFPENQEQAKSRGLLLL